MPTFNMSLFLEFLKRKPVKASLVFGHNDNIIVKSISTTPKHKEALIDITLSQIDPITKEVKATFTGSLWKLDYTSEYAERNFTDMYSILSGLLIALKDDSSELLGKLDEVLDSVETIKDAVSTKNNVKLIHEIITNVFDDVDVSKYTDVLCKCKITTNTKGFLEFSKEENWIVSLASGMELPEVTSIEKERYNKALAKPKETHAQPDNASAGAGEKKVANGLGFGGSL